MPTNILLMMYFCIDLQILKPEAVPKLFLDMESRIRDENIATSTSVTMQHEKGNQKQNDSGKLTNLIDTN